MLWIKKNRIALIALILASICSSLTTMVANFIDDPFTPFIFPGVFFGIALILPDLLGANKFSYNNLLWLIGYEIIWLITLWLYMVLGMSPGQKNKLIDSLLLGAISGLLVFAIYSMQHDFKKPIPSLFSIVLTSIVIFYTSSFLVTSISGSWLLIGFWQFIIGLIIIRNKKLLPSDRI